MNVLDTTVSASTGQLGQQPQAAQSEAPFGRLALACAGVKLPLQVCSTRAGYYLGTYDDEGPCSRESVEYWPEHSQAAHALASGSWTQRLTP
jgi:hypothetical protein